MDERRRGAAPWRGQWPVIGVVAVGGAIGATARYGAALLWPTAAGTFPWTTLTVNAVGCALMGVLMVVITEVRSAHRLVRPFLGTGILGGFTTFSTYAVDIQRLVDARRPALAVAYLAGTLLLALAAVWAAVAGTRALLELRRRTA
ncbi:fluoride efflux transporter CrcB [Streptomyces sioyaensis]|uniref:Fluoride-specific ion channel FluC n=1 Tax=Streptomyces sioyaensis TaxID=67364 RepID=A0A4Q1RB61_9ACTN|nr:fluoride efflux transporter CrcB [Streptomyces sioyaensis]MBM4793565.1 fluoride efflux transporter CrcB [Streptomyces sioyaensis]RXS70672.1 fluoride efflux transporter CrcB [Streptomyces sioyaensis]